MSIQEKTNDVPIRENIALEDQWNTACIYETQKDWQNEFNACHQQSGSSMWPQLQQNAYNLSDPNSLKSLLENLFSIERTLDKLYVYAHLINDQDISNQETLKDLKSITHLITKFAEETSWIRPSLTALDSKEAEKLLNHEDLQTYNFYLKKIFRSAKHTCSANEEKILASAYLPLEATKKAFSSLSDSEIPFEKVHDHQNNELPLSHALASLYMQSEDRVLRQNTYKKQLNRYESYKNTFANLLGGTIHSHVFSAQARNFPSCLDAALYDNNISTSIYTNLLERTKSFTHLISKYFGLKQKALNLKEFKLYDVYAPISTNSSQEKYSYDQAVDIITQTLKPLGDDYIRILKKGLMKDGWVDKYENKNKRSGAYSSGCYDTLPYILLNYTGSLYDISVLAHEAGHSMHSYLSRQSQDYHNAQYPIFLAEIASTLNEMLLMNGLLEITPSKEEKINILTRTLDTVFATLFRQVLFADFELQIHQAAEKGIPLTEEFLSKVYKDLLNTFYGSVINIDSISSLEWARIPHFYYNFYVYQYATGIIAALCFAEKILSNQDNSLKLYLKFLNSGGSNFPVDLLVQSGVDMTTEEPFNKAMTFIDKKIEMLAALF